MLSQTSAAFSLLSFVGILLGVIVGAPQVIGYATAGCLLFVSVFLYLLWRSARDDEDYF
jgi:uncharacterized MnhB-related membrane protein